MLDEKIISDGFYDEDQEALQDTSHLTRCLVFSNGDMKMFMSTEYITEIINDHVITPVPMLPEYVKGIINLRGKILPIVDVRLLMNLDEIEYTDKTCIIVIDVDGITLGIIVDSVLHVEDIDMEQIKPVPVKHKKNLINGMIHLRDGSVGMSFDCIAASEVH